MTDFPGSEFRHVLLGEVTGSGILDELVDTPPLDWFSTAPDLRSSLVLVRRTLVVAAGLVRRSLALVSLSLMVPVARPLPLGMAETRVFPRDRHRGWVPLG